MWGNPRNSTAGYKDKHRGLFLRMMAATLMFTLSGMTDQMPTFGDTTTAAQSYLVNQEIKLPDPTASAPWR